jgi:hypothetical protein
MSQTNQRDSAPAPLPTETVIKLVLAWLFVGIPLTIGVIYTLINAMKLFQ